MHTNITIVNLYNLTFSEDPFMFFDAVTLHLRSKRITLWNWNGRSSNHHARYVPSHIRSTNTKRKVHICCYYLFASMTTRDIANEKIACVHKALWIHISMNIWHSKRKTAAKEYTHVVLYYDVTIFLKFNSMSL